MEDVPEIITEGNGTEWSRIKQAGGASTQLLGTWEMETPVAASASWEDRASCSTSPKAVMESGPRMPAARRAADTRGATR